MRWLEYTQGYTNKHKTEIFDVAKALVQVWIKCKYIKLYKGLIADPESRYKHKKFFILAVDPIYLIVLTCIQFIAIINLIIALITKN